MHNKDLFFCLLRNEICGAELSIDKGFAYNAESLYRLSQAHDLTHLIYDALSRNGILPKDLTKANKFKQEQLLAVYRETQISSIIEIIRDIFGKNEIRFILLKGAVIRNLYPEAWMRTSCDIDVLVREEDLSKAVNVLIKAGFVTDKIKNYHDVSLFYGNVHLELHYNALENIPSIDGLLEKIWDYTVNVNGFEFAEMPEYFVFHHIAHMSYHFLSGGCGIRPFIDLVILREKHFYDEKKLLPLLEKSNLVRFYNGVSELTEVWFGKKEHSEMSLLIEKYILSGGVYGNSKNEHRIKTARNKSKIGYVLNMVFLPYKMMCVPYPILRKHKILLPFCYIHRIFSGLFGKKRKRAKRNLGYILKNDKTAIDLADKILVYLGLESKK